MVEAHAPDQLEVPRDLDLVLQIESTKIQFVGVVGCSGCSPECDGYIGRRIPRVDRDSRWRPRNVEEPVLAVIQAVLAPNFATENHRMTDGARTEFLGEIGLVE